MAVSYSAYDSRFVFTKDYDLLLDNAKTLPNATSQVSTNVLDLGDATGARAVDLWNSRFILFDPSASLTVPTTSTYFYLQDCATAGGTYSTMQTIELATGTYTRALVNRMYFSLANCRRFVRIKYDVSLDASGITMTAAVVAGQTK